MTAQQDDYLGDFGSLAKSLLPFLGLIGGVLYAVLRIAYVSFYLQLRATPEEVGYGYASILASQLVGAIDLVVVIMLLLLIVDEAWGHIRRFVWHEERPNWRVRLLSRGRRYLWPAVGLVFLGLPFLAWQEGADAAQGFTVRNVYLYGTSRLPVLAVQAVPATVISLGADGTDLAARPCLMFLGSADGTTVFYDVRSRESLRVPSASILITLQDTPSVPIGC
jgi:hypothetical protein